MLKQLTIKILWMTLTINGLCHCVSESGSQEVKVFDQVNPQKPYKFTLSPAASPSMERILTLALNHWNESMMDFQLSYVRGSSEADVKISYNFIDELRPSHTKLIGCLDGYRHWFDCEIQLELPSQRVLADNLHILSHFFKEGPLDDLLLETYAYQGDHLAYLGDKIMLVAMIHEIGHTLGLAHSGVGSDCIMAPAPDGNAKICTSERQAIRAKLGLSDNHHQMISRPAI